MKIIGKGKNFRGDLTCNTLTTKEEIRMDTNTNSSFPFNVEEFRQDVTNNVKFKELKVKYHIKTRIEFDGYLHRLCKLDQKIYDYRHSEVVRGLPVYESKDGFVKISPREVKKIKSVLKCGQLVFGDLFFDGKNKITVEVMAA